MSNPILLVIAGCNGAGKSSFSRLLSADEFDPFDYDIQYLKHYRSLLDSELRETIAHNKAFFDLESGIQEAIQLRKNFCYETNFNSTPLFWPQHFKNNGYEIQLIFLCLDSVDEARKRVAIRVANGGHFVPDQEIKNRFFDGYKNLDAHFKFFDKVDLFDVSGFEKFPQYVLSYENNKITAKNTIPDFLLSHISNILSTSKEL